MNIFRFGLLLSVLLFNLSCSILPERTSLDKKETTENQHTLEIENENVSEKSFIEFESNKEMEINELLALLIKSEQHMDNTTSELKLTKEELKQIETTYNQIENLEEKKKFLQTKVSLLH